MIYVKVPSQTSRGIFVYAEIIQMHTIRKSNYTVVKQPCTGNSKAKKITKKQFSLLKFSCTINGMDALDEFYRDHPCVD